MTTTTHNGALYGVERGLLDQLTHYVDGTPLVGGRGIPLADMLADSYRREADELLADLDRVALAMSDGDLAQLVDRMRSMASVIERPAAILHQDDKTAAFTADYRDGGRPITGEHDEVPDPPALVPAVDSSDDGSDGKS